MWMVLSTCILHRIFNCILFKKRKAGISAMLTLLWGIDFINNTVPLRAVFQSQWLCFSKSPFGDLKWHVWGCYWTYLFFVWKMLHKKVFVCRHVLLDSDLGLHICFEFSQHPLMFISSYANTEKVLCVENTTIKRNVFLWLTIKI